MDFKFAFLWIFLLIHAVPAMGMFRGPDGMYDLSTFGDAQRHTILTSLNDPTRAQSTMTTLKNKGLFTSYDTVAVVPPNNANEIAAIQAQLAAAQAQATENAKLAEQARQAQLAAETQAALAAAATDAARQNLTATQEALRTMVLPQTLEDAQVEILLLREKLDVYNRRDDRHLIFIKDMLDALKELEHQNTLLNGEKESLIREKEEFIASHEGVAREIWNILDKPK